jgi:hypothetical protein
MSAQSFSSSLTRRDSLRWMLSPLLGSMLAQRLAAQQRMAEIIVYGATSAGIAAAVQARRMGKTVLVIDPGTHIGGLTTGGLSWTDIGNKMVIGGVAREFYQRIKAKYEPESMWRWESRNDYYTKKNSPNRSGEDAMWTFEPKIASDVYQDLLREHGIEVQLRQRLDLRPGRGVRMRGPWIEAIRTEDGTEYIGGAFIDATYEGDLMARAGVKYTVGREANAQYGETLNGVQVAQATKHQFPPPCKVSPYIKPDNPRSGLLPIIDANGPGEEGGADQRIQAYNYRLCMTSAKANQIPVEKPAGYDERDHELLLRYAESGHYHPPDSKWDPIPNAKTDTNNHGAVSTDYIGANYLYPDGDYHAREEIIERHQIYTKGYLWTLQNHPRVPENLRAYYGQWAWPKDEFVENGNFPTQLYVREARRMVSGVVMSQQHVQARDVAKDSVGMGAYGMDSHNQQRYVDTEGFVRNEGDVQVGGFKPYPISYQAIIPTPGQADNLLVPVCLSATHIAFGSIRMEPVFMVLGQSAATAACFALDAGQAMHSVNYGRLREKLLADEQILDLPAAG